MRSSRSSTQQDQSTGDSDGSHYAAGRAQARRHDRRATAWLLTAGLLTLFATGDEGASIAWRSEEQAEPAIIPPPPTPSPEDHFEAEGTYKERDRWFYEQRRYPYDRIPVGAREDALRFRREHLSTFRLEPGARGTVPQTVTGDTWFNLGPNHVAHSTLGGVSGRIRAIAVDPVVPSTIYVGGATGGVWRTTNGGATWKPLTDYEGGLSMGSIAIDPDDRDIIYAGTGELRITHDAIAIHDYLGVGLLRSFDGGSRWTRVDGGLFTGQWIAKVALDPASLSVSAARTSRRVYVAAQNGVYVSGNSGLTWSAGPTLACQATDLVIDPVSPGTVYAACHSDGIWKSTSSGNAGTWSRIVDLNGELPASQFRRINLAISPTLPTVLVATMQDEVAFNQLKGVWRTFDGGDHWDQLAGAPPAFGLGNFDANPDVNEAEPNGSFAQANGVLLRDVAEGAISSNTDKDYYRVQITGAALLVEIMAARVAGNTLNPAMKIFYDDNGTVRNLCDVVGNQKICTLNGGFNRTNDVRFGGGGWLYVLPAGTYYIEVSGLNNTTGPYQVSFSGIDPGCQCDYDQVVAIDPTNVNIMYFGGLRMLRSIDGGVNWTRLDDPKLRNLSPPLTAVHGDIHTMAFHPTDTNIMYWGSDGGIWKTTDLGDHWTTLNTSLSLLQIVPGMSQHDTNPDFLLMGSQDNSTTMYKNGTWSQPPAKQIAGDGAFTAIDWSDATQQTWYFSSQNLWLGKTTDDGQTATTPQKQLGRVGAAWVAPFRIDPANAQVLIAGGGKCSMDANNRCLPGTLENLVYRTTNGAGVWAENSPALGGTITALVFAPSNSNIYYAGTLNGRLWRTTNAGADGNGDGTPDWTRRDTGLPNRFITDIAVHPTNPNTLYASFGGLNAGHVYRSTNGGDTWMDISRVAPNGIASVDLPNITASVVVVDPTFPSTVFVGNDIGVFRTTNADAAANVAWEAFDFGLPVVPVTDLVISATTSKMRAATYGRGVWELGVGNDECDNAPLITDGDYTGFTDGAHTDGAATCGITSNSPDVWYRYTATCDGMLHVDTCGAEFDTVVSIHLGICSNLSISELPGGCNDDCRDASCGEFDSCAAASVAAGGSYLIRVSGHNGAGGKFPLHVECRVPNDECDNATLVSVPSSTDGSTVGAAVDNPSFCDETVDSPGVWYTVIGTGTIMTASLCNAETTFDTKLNVYCSGCAGSQCIAGSDDACNRQSEVSWCAAPGTLYHILVHGAGDDGRFRLDVSHDGTACQFSLSCTPSNDLCSHAIPVHQGRTIGDNTSAMTDGSASCRASTRDVWYRLDPVCHGFATINTCDASGSLADTVLNVFDGCGGREIACNDDSCGASGYRSEVKIPLVAGSPILIRVADYANDGDQGSFPLDVSLTPPSFRAPRPGLYVVDGHNALEDHLLHLDPITGLMDDVGPLGNAAVAGLAYAPSLGIMYSTQDGIDDDSLGEVNLTTGQVSVFVDPGFNAVRALAFDANTLTLYGVDTNLDQLIRFNPFSGEGTQIGTLGFSQIEGLTFDPISNTLFGSDIGTDQLIRINTTSGAGTAVGSYGGDFGRIEDIAFDAVTGTLYGLQHDFATGAGRLVTIDPSTGAATQVGSAYANMAPNGLAIVPGLPDATQHEPYDATVPLGSGCPPYRIGNINGLPDGLSMSSGGRISGIPDESGIFTIAFDVTDSNIASLGETTSFVLRVRPANDDCENALAISDGPTPYVTLEASTDGPPEPTCGFCCGDDQINQDIWYCYEATCTGSLTVSLCDSSFDTKLAVYEGCGCLPSIPPVVCNDDDCATQSSVVWEVAAGERYTIRVGGYRQNEGTGQIDITCEGVPTGACCTDSGCDIALAEVCAERGGSYQGDDTLCAPDADGDGFIDNCDDCPGDVGKREPGVCGCGRPDTDSDGDGAPDCIDDCPFDPNKLAAGTCGCNEFDNDSDGDGAADCVDGCPDDPTKTTPEVCGCGVLDIDSDGDGVADCIDDCPFEPALVTPDEPGTEVTCDDGVDNDCDGSTDLDDDDCVAADCVCGDLNSDGTITLDDYSSFFYYCFGLTAPEGLCTPRDWTCSDLTGDGRVDLDDVAILTLSFGQPASPANCPP